MVYQTIRQAILEKKQVVAMYDGLRREMCPHVIGTKNGREQALFYQFGGQSSQEVFPVDHPQAYRNWRCMFIDQLTLVEVRGGPWYSISPHTRPQTCVDQVDVEVEGWV